jgi:endonuclease/exonuclease/phosphatase family protein
MKLTASLLIFFGFLHLVTAQKEYTVACIAFYNLENLFDTLDSPDTDDFEFTPGGPNLYNSTI